MSGFLACILWEKNLYYYNILISKMYYKIILKIRAY
ncbi:MAG: hypothetical protein A4E47_01296 [Methanosaeta sp. PtaU1.Bin028]|nr:MAG: hypothetical protein A4E47_01296 [Methanosaeta sp. PtaU1.Bin028]